jgi:hypothetical protein
MSKKAVGATRGSPTTQNDFQSNKDRADKIIDEYWAWEASHPDGDLEQIQEIA